MDSNFGADDIDAWDFDLLDDILRKAEEDNAARRASQHARFQVPAINLGTATYADSVTQAGHPSAVQYVSEVSVQGSLSGVRSAVYGSSSAQAGSSAVNQTYATADAAWKTGCYVSQQVVTGPELKTVEQKLHDSGVAGFKSGFTISQSQSQADMQNRSNQRYGALVSNQLAAQRDGYDGMPPPPPPTVRQYLQSEVKPVGSVHQDSMRSECHRPPGGMHNYTSSDGFDSWLRGGEDEEKVKLREELAAKMDTVSVLRYRLSQTEKELNELKSRASRPSNGYPAPDQVRELNRLSSELLFKDQELLEAKRARANKDEQLKVALASAAAMKQELEVLKQGRGGAPHDLQQQDPERNNNGKIKVSTLGQMLADSSPSEQQEPTTAVALSPTIRRRSGQALSLKSVAEGKSKSVASGYHQDNLVAAAPHTDHSTGDGREGATKGPVIHGLQGVAASVEMERNRASKSDFEAKRLSDFRHSLQHIWGLKDLKDDGVAVLPRLFSTCRRELYVLLNLDADSCEKITEQHQDVSKKRKEPENANSKRKTAQKLYDAITEMANRHASALIVMSPLLEFCNMADDEVVRCALHTLRHLLQLDNLCREAVLGRKTPSISSSEGGREFVSPSSSYLYNTGRQGWSVIGSSEFPSAEGTQKESSGFPVFSSSRIICRGRGQEKGDLDSLQKQPSTTDQPTIVPTVSRAQEKLCVMEDEQPLSRKSWFVGWLLDMASRWTCPRVQAEAAAIVNLLVAHSEPQTERIQFGFMLFDGSLARLLKNKGKHEIQLFGVKIALLLLHCPSIFQRFCASKDLDKAEAGTEQQNKELEIVEEIQVDAAEDDREAAECEDGKKSETSLSSAVERAEETLRGLSDCLTHNGSSLQEYTLRRNVVRVLTFLATSGDLGAATVIRGVITAAHRASAKKEDEGGVVRSRPGPEGEGLPDSTALKSLTGERRERGVTGKAARAQPSSSEQVHSIPWQLIFLIDSELEAEEEEEHGMGSNKSLLNEERASLLREALCLLSRLAARPSTSSAVLSALTVSTETLRQTVSITNRLISRGHSFHLTRSHKHSAHCSDMMDQARGLRERILSSLPDWQDPRASGKPVPDAARTA